MVIRTSAFSILAYTFAGVFSTSSFADYATAYQAYQSKEFATAFTEFERLAKLGDLDSQKNLAAMYARGEGTQTNWVEAYAWASLLPSKDGQPDLIVRTAQKKLTEDQLTTAQQLASSYAKQFSQSAVADALLPVADIREADCTIENITPAKPIKTVPPRYPRDAAIKGIQAVVFTDILVGKNGTPAHIYVTSVQTNYTEEKSQFAKAMEKQFADVTLAALKKWVFAASDNTLSERPRKFSLDFKLQGSGDGVISSSPIAFKARIEELKSRAIAQDAIAQFELASLYESDGPLYQQGRQAEITEIRHKLYMSGAINGSSAAQFKVAKRLLSGDQCAKDERKGIFWLTLAAQNNDADAQFALAWRLHHGDGVVADAEKSLYWLEKAANNGHREAQLRLGIYNAQHNKESSFDLRSILDEKHKQDSFLEIELKAIAAAWVENWELAESLQQDVVRIATEAGFPLENRLNALAKIKSKIRPTFDRVL